MVKLNVKDIIKQHNRFKGRFWGYGSCKLYNIKKEFKSHYLFHFHFTTPKFLFFHFHSSMLKSFYFHFHFSTSKLLFSWLFWHTKIFFFVHFHSSKQDVIFKLKSRFFLKYVLLPQVMKKCCLMKWINKLLYFYNVLLMLSTPKTYMTTRMKGLGNFLIGR
jgi:hypothetical protein